MTIANNSFSLNSFKITSGSVTFGPGTWNAASTGAASPTWTDSYGGTNTYIDVTFYDAISTSDPTNSLFTSTPLVVVSLGSIPAYSSYMVARARNVTSSGFQAYVYHFGSNTAPLTDPITLNWIAIGT